MTQTGRVHPAPDISRITDTAGAKHTPAADAQPGTSTPRNRTNTRSLDSGVTLASEGQPTPATETTEPTEELPMATTYEADGTKHTSHPARIVRGHRPLTQLPGANAILTDGQGRNMLARFDERTQRWTIALPCGQIATGIRPASIIERVATQGWTVCS